MSISSNPFKRHRPTSSTEEAVEVLLGKQARVLMEKMSEPESRPDTLLLPTSLEKIELPEEVFKNKIRPLKEIIDQIDSPKQKTHALLSVAQAALQTKNFGQARRLLADAQQIADAIENKRSRLDVHLLIAQLAHEHFEKMSESIISQTATDASIDDHLLIAIAAENCNSTQKEELLEQLLKRATAADDFRTWTAIVSSYPDDTVKKQAAGPLLARLQRASTTMLVADAKQDMAEDTAHALAKIGDTERVLQALDYEFVNNRTKARIVSAAAEANFPDTATAVLDTLPPSVVHTNFAFMITSAKRGNNAEFLLVLSQKIKHENRYRAIASAVEILVNQGDFVRAQMLADQLGQGFAQDRIVKEGNLRHLENRQCAQYMTQIYAALGDIQKAKEITDAMPFEFSQEKFNALLALAHAQNKAGDTEITTTFDRLTKDLNQTPDDDIAELAILMEKTGLTQNAMSVALAASGSSIIEVFGKFIFSPEVELDKDDVGSISGKVDKILEDPQSYYDMLWPSPEDYIVAAHIKEKAGIVEPEYGDHLYKTLIEEFVKKDIEVAPISIVNNMLSHGGAGALIRLFGAKKVNAQAFLDELDDEDRRKIIEQRAREIAQELEKQN